MLKREGASREEVVAVVGPMELFGEEALQLEGFRRYRAVAGPGCTVLPLAGKRLLKALRGSPKTLSTFIATQARDQTRHLQSAGAPSKVRIADVLVDLTERFGEEEGRKERESR